jgi:hypothetical protein
MGTRRFVDDLGEEWETEGSLASRGITTKIAPLGMTTRKTKAETTAISRGRCSLGYSSEYLCGIHTAEWGGGNLH